MTFVPVDQDARERARRDHATSFVLEAGAGTGKTTLLVDRIEQIVRSGAARLDDHACVSLVLIDLVVHFALDPIPDVSEDGSCSNRIELVDRKLAVCQFIVLGKHIVHSHFSCDGARSSRKPQTRCRDDSCIFCDGAHVVATSNASVAGVLNDRAAWSVDQGARRDRPCPCRPSPHCRLCVSSTASSSMRASKHPKARLPDL